MQHLSSEQSLDAFIAELDARAAARTAAIESYIARHGERPFQTPSKDGWLLVVTKDPSKPSQWRVTRFEELEPVGHTEARTFRDAIDAVYDHRGAMPTDATEGQIV